MISSVADGATPSLVLYEGTLLAEYFQVYLRDEDHPVLPEDYTDEAIARHLVAGAHAVVLHTARNMPVPIRLEWHNQYPAVDLDAYQHIVEACIDCPSGRLVLAGLTDYDPTALRLSVRAGPLCVRAAISAPSSTLPPSG